MTPTAQRSQMILRRLTELGVASPQQIEEAREEQGRSKERFAAVLVKQGIIRDAENGKRLAAQLGWMIGPFDPSQRNPALTKRLSVEFCRTHRVMPIQEHGDGQLILATDDPLNIFAVDWLRRHCGTEVDLILVREHELSPLLERWDEPASLEASSPEAKRVVAAAPIPAAIVAPSPPPSVTVSSLVSKPLPVSKPAPVREPERAEGSPGKAVSASDEPIVQLVDSLLREAVQMRASDIHIEAQADVLRVRYRIDGVLRDVNTPPKALQGPITSRIKIMAGLNIAEKRLPQDGGFQPLVEGEPVDVRISTLPALHGESIVMRLLKRDKSIQGLSDLGLSEADNAHWKELIGRPYGMILVTGPTGSGKSTTLYATLEGMNRVDRKIITVEDPVEYRLTGVNQVNVKAAIGLTFAAGLRAMLRQAPDVIMVGEIRDPETAQIAIQAALTGHLVLSTLHTNDAASAVTRLMDMGVAAFLAASTVQGVLAQRLIRRLCTACQRRRPATEEEQAFLGQPLVREVTESAGCDACQGAGYYGRIGIYELLTLSDALRDLVAKKAQASALRRQAAAEGLKTLRDDGRRKIREGLSTVLEVLRATPESEEPPDREPAQGAEASGKRTPGSTRRKRRADPERRDA